MEHDLKYFATAAGPEALAARYRELAKRLHPDKAGASGEEIVKMKEEYDFVREKGVPSGGTTSKSRVSSEMALDLLSFVKTVSSVLFPSTDVSMSAERALKEYLGTSLVVVHPTLTDPLEPTIIQASRDSQTYMVPSWHKILVYDDDTVVLVEPALPDGVSLDDSNNLNVCIYTAPDSVLDCFLGTTTLVAGTSLILRNRGVPQCHNEDMYSHAERKHVLIHA